MIPSLWPTAPDIQASPKNITINPGISNIDYPTANILLETGKVKLVDVREVDEYKQGYIINAINIPVDSIKEEVVSSLLPNRNEPIIVYCLSGKRALDATLKLRRLGYNYILNMGGISHWPYGTISP